MYKNSRKAIECGTITAADNLPKGGQEELLALREAEVEGLELGGVAILINLNPSIDYLLLNYQKDLFSIAYELYWARAITEPSKTLTLKVHRSSDPRTQ